MGGQQGAVRPYFELDRLVELADKAGRGVVPPNVGPLFHLLPLSPALLGRAVAMRSIQLIQSCV